MKSNNIGTRVISKATASLEEEIEQEVEVDDPSQEEFEKTVADAKEENDGD